MKEVEIESMSLRVEVAKDRNDLRYMLTEDVALE